MSKHPKKDYGGGGFGPVHDDHTEVDGFDKLYKRLEEAGKVTEPTAPNESNDESVEIDNHNA